MQVAAEAAVGLALASGAVDKPREKGVLELELASAVQAEAAGGL